MDQIGRHYLKENAAASDENINQTLHTGLTVIVTNQKEITEKDEIERDEIEEVDVQKEKDHENEKFE